MVSKNSIENLANWPEIRRARIITNGQHELVRYIHEAPTNIRRAVAAEILELHKSRFLTPYVAWTAVGDVLRKHLPDIAQEADAFLMEITKIKTEKMVYGRLVINVVGGAYAR